MWLLISVSKTNLVLMDCKVFQINNLNISKDKSKTLYLKTAE